MSQPVWGNRVDEPSLPIWLVVCSYLVLALTDLRTVFAWPWMIGRSDVVIWWVKTGYWAACGGLVLFFGAVLMTAIYSQQVKPKGVRWVTLAFAIVAVTCLFMATRSRVEVRADDIRVTWEDPQRGEVIYRVEHASAMTVSCSSGQKRKIYPSVYVEFFDGYGLELSPLILPGGNRSGRRDGLVMVERFDRFLAARGNRYTSRHYRIADRCVDRTARRLGKDSERVAHIFRTPRIVVQPEMAEWVGS